MRAPKIPENMLLWRMNRQRLDIESLRDSMLAVSGQIDLTVGGLPYSLTAAAVRSQAHRLRLHRARPSGRLPLATSTSPAPINTRRFAITPPCPQQALFLLNSAFITEQASHLIERPAIQSADTTEKRIAELYRIVYGRAAIRRRTGARREVPHRARRANARQKKAAPGNMDSENSMPPRAS